MPRNRPVNDPHLIDILRRLGTPATLAAAQRIEGLIANKPPEVRQALQKPEVMRALKKDIKREGGQSAWAKRHDMTPQHVFDVLHGRRGPGGRILAALGLRRVVSYEPLDAGS